MNTTRFVSVFAAAAGLTLASQAALAYSGGDFFVRGGFVKSEVESDNGRLNGESLEVGDDTGFSYGLGYLFHDQVGIELSGTEKFEHDLTLGGDSIGSVDRMPVNLLVNYYPLGGMDSRVQPYVGAGVNYTRFSGEPSGVDVDRSWGATGQVGIDLAVTENVMLNGFTTFTDVDGDVSMNGSEVGTADVDPWTIGGGVTLRF